MDMVAGHLRRVLNLPPFVVISQFKQSSECIGKVFHMSQLYDCLKKPHNNQSMIAFVDEADGTEEIPASNLRAVVLKHDLPQLSHLAIRARQTKILFVCCETPQVYDDLKR